MAMILLIRLLRFRFKNVMEQLLHLPERYILPTVTVPVQIYQPWGVFHFQLAKKLQILRFRSQVCMEINIIMV